MWVHVLYYFKITIGISSNPPKIKLQLSFK